VCELALGVVEPPMRASRPKRGLATALTVLAALLLLPAVAPAAGTVAVTGKATLAVPNDTATVGLGASALRPTKAAALRVLAKRVRAMIAAAQAIPGVGDGDVRTGSVGLGQTRRGERRLFRAGQGITVTLHEPERAGELIGAGIRAGAGAVSGPRFFVGDTGAAYNVALSAAFDQARAKAATLAARAGATLGAVVSIAEGGGVEPVQAGSPMRGESKADAAPPTKPSTTTVTATVSVVFALQ
jgi:uncharacterized protein YggE